MSTRDVETAEEAHFLVRSGCWTAEDLEAWAILFGSPDSEEIEYDEVEL